MKDMLALPLDRLEDSDRTQCRFYSWDHLSLVTIAQYIDILEVDVLLLVALMESKMFLESLAM